MIHCRLLLLLGVDQRRDGGIAAYLGQAAAAGRADAANRDAQPGADLGVGQRRVRDKQGDQPLAVRRQVSERLAQCRVALSFEQFLFGALVLPGREVLGVEAIGVCVRSVVAGPARTPAGSW